MQFTFDLDIQAVVAKAMAPEKIQPMLEKALSDAIKSCIDEATGYSSEFRKAVKVQLAEAMPHGLDITDVAKFQQVANAVIANAVHGVNSETIATALKKSIGEIVPDIPARIKLSDLIDRAREGFHKESHEGFYARIERSDFSDGYYTCTWMRTKAHPRNTAASARTITPSMRCRSALLARPTA